MYFHQNGKSGDDKKLLWDVRVFTLLQVKLNIMTIMRRHERPYHLITSATVLIDKGLQLTSHTSEQHPN